MSLPVIGGLHPHWLAKLLLLLVVVVPWISVFVGALALSTNRVWPVANAYGFVKLEATRTVEVISCEATILPLIDASDELGTVAGVHVEALGLALIVARCASGLYEDTG